MTTRDRHDEKSGDYTPQSGRRLSGAGEATRAAVTEFAGLTGRQPDSVTGVRRTDDGWSILVDVVELDRIPASTSVMATYRVDVGPDGALGSYERLRRYHRGATDPS